MVPFSLVNITNDYRFHGRISTLSFGCNRRIIEIDSNRKKECRMMKFLNTYVFAPLEIARFYQRQHKQRYGRNDTL
jgi:hypothetical protein